MSAPTKWDRMPCVAFDLETTGINPHHDRIVTAAVIKIQPGQRPIAYTYIVDPGIDIPEEAAAVHGYTRDRAIAEATHPADVALFEMTGLLARALGAGVPVVGFNVSYDLTLLEAENVRHHVDPLTSRLDKGVKPIIDAHVLDKAADKYRKGPRRLDATCEAYGVRHTGAHDSTGDALATARLWPRIIAKNPDLFRGFLVPTLHEAQKQWRREQMDGLRRYFDRTGKDHDGCCGEWPLHVACAQQNAEQGVLL